MLTTASFLPACLQGFHVARLAADLRELLTQLNLSEVTLVGSSMGSAVIWSYIYLFGEERLARVRGGHGEGRVVHPPTHPPTTCPFVCVHVPLGLQDTCKQCVCAVLPCTAPVLPPYCLPPAGRVCGPGPPAEHDGRLEVGQHRVLRPALPHPPAVQAPDGCARACLV